MLAGSVGCQARVVSNLPTPVIPTRIPTATALPPLPTLPAPGSEANPLRFLFVTEELADAQEAAEALAEAASGSTDLTIEVSVSDSYADAYHALCDGTAVVVSLDAFAYLAASEAGCAEPIYVAERDGEIATQGQLVAQPNRVFSVPNFRDRAFCRNDSSPVNGWIVPTLALRANGIDPFSGLRAIVSAASDEEVLRLIIAGQCEVGATAAGAEAELTDPAAIEVVEELPPVPNDVVVLSTGLDEDMRALLLDVLREYRDDLTDLLGADALRQATDQDFAQLRALVDAAGVDVLALSE